MMSETAVMDDPATDEPTAEPALDAPEADDAAGEAADTGE